METAHDSFDEFLKSQGGAAPSDPGVSEGKDAFEKLIDLVIDSFKVTLNDSIALDANGIIGRQRILIVDNPRYQRATKTIRAQRTIADLKGLDELIESMEEDDEGEGSSEESSEEHSPDATYDIRSSEVPSLGRGSKRKSTGAQETEVRATKETLKPQKRFDKGKMEMRLKLLASKRELMTSTEEEDRENDAMNIFFYAMTKEEMEAEETVEVSEGTRSGMSGLDSEVEDSAAKGLVAKKDERKGMAGFHIEHGADGEEIEVFE
jgi:hypothetical protein